MLWIIPMAGKGTRTKQFGEFKPFISLRDKLMIEWLLISLRSKIQDSDSVVCITTQYFADKYYVHKILNSLFEKLKIKASLLVHTTKKTPPGPAVTVFSAQKKINLFKENTIYVNSDQYIDFTMPPIPLKPNTGFLPVYAEFSNKSNYVTIQNDYIDYLVEKKNISNLAIPGVYAVAKPQDLLKAIKIQIDKKITHKGEYFIGPALNNLIKTGYKFIPVKTIVKYDIGDAQGIKQFIQFIDTMKTYGN